MDKYNFRLSFVLCRDKNGTKKENLQIKASISFGGQRVLYYIGYRVDKDNWEEERLKNGKRHQYVKTNTFNRQGVDSKTINSKLTRVITACDNLFRRFEGEGRQFVSTDDVRKGLREELNDVKPQRRIPLKEYYLDFIKTQGKTRRWKHSTYIKHQTILRHLNEFHPDLCFEEINENLLNEFIDFLLFKKQLTNGYVSKLYDNLRWFFNWATERGFNKRDDYKKHHPKFPGTAETDNSNTFALTKQELMRIYNMDIKQQSIAQVRDVFCFCCATSLRYSDVKALRWDDVHDGMLDITTEKTTDHLVIPLCGMALEILKKYEENRGYTEQVLPVISNQRYNEHLKTLGKMANLYDTVIRTTYRGNDKYVEKLKKWELLSSHVARRTFVTIGISLGIPSDIIRKVTGHKTHKMMDRYERLCASDIKEGLKAFDTISDDFADKSTVFDFDISDEERLTLGIPVQEVYEHKVEQDRQSAILDLALLFYIRKDKATSFDYATHLNDRHRVQYMNVTHSL
jgi:integrase